MRANPNHPKLKALEDVVSHLGSHDIILLKVIFFHPELKNTPLHDAAHSQGLKYLYDVLGTVTIFIALHGFLNGNIKRGIVKSVLAIFIEKINSNTQILFNLNDAMLKYMVNTFMHTVVPFLTIPHSVGNSIINLGNDTKNLIMSNLLFFARPFGMQRYFSQQEPAIESVKAVLTQHHYAEVEEDRHGCIIC